MASKLLVGSLLDAYSAQDQTDGKTPPAGYRYRDESANKEYIFTQNAGATALTAKMCAKGNDTSAFKVEITSALNDAVAGVRPAGATQLLQNEWGYIQTKGNGTCVFGDTAVATVAGRGVVADDDTDKGKIGSADTTVDLTGNDAADKTDVEASLDALEAIFGIAQTAVNTTDADVEVELNCKVFG